MAVIFVKPRCARDATGMVALMSMKSILFLIWSDGGEAEVLKNLDILTVFV